METNKAKNEPTVSLESPDRTSEERTHQVLSNEGSKQCSHTAVYQRSSLVT